jgi:hypothetical protein
MIKSDRKEKELTALLANRNSLVVSEGIAMLRDEEPFEGAIGLLVSYYDKTDDERIRKTIEEFLNDLKDQSVTSEIITEIRKPFSHETISMLVASCWQSGLNYAEYSEDMVNIFLRSDYMTALECLTVIEESVHELSAARRNEFISIIEDYPRQKPDEKAGLAHELIAILKQEYSE